MPQDAPATPTRLVDGRLLLSDNCSIDIWTRLHYDAQEPYAVTVTFLLDEAHEVEWVLARDLLGNGLHGRAGEGDVMLRPIPVAISTEVELMLLAVTGAHARVTLPAEAVAAFLRASHHVVPPGAETEHLNLETTISQLLSN